MNPMKVGYLLNVSPSRWEPEAGFERLNEHAGLFKLRRFFWLNKQLFNLWKNSLLLCEVGKIKKGKKKDHIWRVSMVKLAFNMRPHFICLFPYAFCYFLAHERNYFHNSAWFSPFILCFTGISYCSCHRAVVMPVCVPDTVYSFHLF
jgi:hypothetical protein